MKDLLFLLGPHFQDEAGNIRYCGDSVAVEGMLSFFPILRKYIDVHYLDAARPRHPLIGLIGEENQSLPALIIADPDAASKSGVAVKAANDRAFVNDEGEIRRYLSARYGVGSVA